jgi:hypothetical protein
VSPGGSASGIPLGRAQKRAITSIGTMTLALPVPVEEVDVIRAAVREYLNGGEK